MTYAPVSRRGMWAFMRPLSGGVWVALAATIFIVPFLVVLFETAFSRRCVYIDQDGRPNLWVALKEATWHSVSLVLETNVFVVHALQSRIVVATYALLVRACLLAAVLTHQSCVVLAPCCALCSFGFQR
jgi:hypothetical protein